MSANKKQTKGIKIYLKPTLKNIGYQTSGQTWRKDKGDFFTLINLQNSSWNSKEKVDFCFNIDVALKATIVFQYLTNLAGAGARSFANNLRRPAKSVNPIAMNNSKPLFAPELFIPNGLQDISFYEKAFGATELRRFSNDDGSIHVSELSIDGALFHLHEVTAKSYYFAPGAHSGTTVCIGLFVADVGATMKNALSAGAAEISPAQDYDYGYRQGTIRDPFGHYWQLQQRI